LTLFATANLAVCILGNNFHANGFFIQETKSSLEPIMHQETMKSPSGRN
jgi:hypothetical protein